MADVNPSTLAAGLGREISKIPSSLIREQDIFTRGLVKFNASNELVNSMSGVVYATLTEAIEDTTRSGISELSIFTGLTGPLSPEPQGYAPLSDMTRNINEMLRSNNPDTVEFRSRNKILKDLEGKNIELVRIGYSNTDEQTVENMANLFDDQISYPTTDLERLQTNFKKKDILPPGYLSSRDGSSTLLRIRYQTPEGYKYLTGKETTNLFSTVDAQFINVERLAKGIPAIDDLMAGPNSAGARLGSTMGKMSKRESQSLTKRNTTMGQQEVGDIVENLSKKVSDRFKLATPKTLEESFLFFDAPLETTLQAFDLEASYTNTLLGDTTLTQAQRQGILRERMATRLVMRGESGEASQQLFRDMLDMQGLSSDQDFDDFAKVIQSQFKETIADRKNQKISLQDIISRIEKTAGEESMDPVLRGKYQRYATALGEIKKIDDGSGFVTGFPFKQHAEQLRASINEAKAMLPAYAQGSEEALTLTSNISSFKSQLDRIVINSSDLLKDDIIEPVLRPFEHSTARLFFKKFQGKSVFDMITGKGSIEEPLSSFGFMGAGSTELLKKEGGLGGMNFPGSKTLGPTAGEQITLQINTGSGMDKVYSEPQAMIFHREQYGANFRRDLGESADMAMDEMDNISKGIISEKARRSILSDATLDIDGMDIEDITRRFGSRAGAERVRSTGITLQNMLASGNVKVNEVPELANGLIRVIMNDAFREKGSYSKMVNGVRRDGLPIYNYAMPYAQRQAIDTEGAVSRRGKNIVLGASRSRTELSAFNKFTAQVGDQSLGTAENIDLSLFQFRHVGHKMIIPNLAATGFGIYEAGGGFDLDDKFITNLQSVRNSQGVRQLTSFAWRQPTGPQEFALMAPYLDDDTLMRMFGDENQMGQRFRGLSEGVSEFINTNSGYNISADIKNQLNALELEKLSKEQKIFKYLNALSHNQKNIAMQYKKSAGDVTQEDLQRAIFKLVDLNGNENFTLDGLSGAASISGDDFANKFLNARGAGHKGIKHKYLNISETSEAIVRKAAMTKAGTMATLNADEIMKLPSGLQSAYRQSNLTQIIKTQSSPIEDLFFQKEIRDLYGAGRNLEDFDRYMDETKTGLSKMEKSLRIASHLVRLNEDEREIIGVRSAITGMTQRSGMDAMTAPTGGLGTYVNRLGWAVSSEEQRLAILDNAITYANKTGNTALLEMAERLKLSTSLVYNPEGVIDAAGAAKMKINLAATPSDLFVAATLTKETGLYTDEEISSSISRALFTLVQKEDRTDLTVLARKAGITVTEDNIEDVVNQIFLRNDEITQELISLISVTDENVGRTLIANTSHTIGSIRAMQEIFGEELQKNTGLMGLDEYVANLKLSVISDAMGNGDINTVIDSMLAGIEEVELVTGQSLSSGSKLHGLRALRVAEQVQGKTRKSPLESRAGILKILGLEGEAKEIYGIPDFEAIVAPFNSKKQMFLDRLKTQKYNEYVPFEQIAIRYRQSESLNTSMKSLLAGIKFNLENTEGQFGRSVDDLVQQNSVLKRIKDITLSKRTLNKDNLGDALVRAGVLDKSELADLIGNNNEGMYENARSLYVRNIQASNSMAKLEVTNAVSQFFNNNDPSLNNIEDVMDKLLFDIGEMTQADRVSGRSTAAQRARATIGKILDDVLKSENPMEITLPTSEKITLQELSKFTRNRMQQVINKPFKDIEDDIVAFIQAARNNSTDPDMLAQEDLMDKKFLSKLFNMDTPSATNPETGLLDRIPGFVDSKEIEDILSSINGKSGKVDLQFAEDFLAFIDNDNQAADLINQRIRSAASAGTSEEAISEEIFSRISLVSSAKNSYQANREAISEEMIAIRDTLERASVKKNKEGTRTLPEMVDKFMEEASGLAKGTDDEIHTAVDRAIASSYDASGAAPAAGKYTRIQDFMKSPQMRELYEGALKNKGKIAGVAAIATGLAIFGSINKKERTREAMSGPPLLPGGNPYERIPTQQMQIPNAPIASGNQGMSYNISVDGDQDNMEQFMNRARISNKWEGSRYYA